MKLKLLSFDRKGAEQAVKEDKVATKVVVEILGHKAQIESVSGRLADPPWWPEDRIQVWLDFEKPVGSTLSVGISLPVKSYTQDEFLAAVRREGEHRLNVIQEDNRTKRELRESKEQKQKELDKIACEIKSLVGLD
ncbi:hypothetical protein ES703_52233 [subsurface metagenome]